jgi:hypothetical protein
MGGYQWGLSPSHDIGRGCHMYVKTFRCFAERKETQWQAFCVDLNLAVQGDTFPIVKQKLDEMVRSYVHLALENDDDQVRSDMLDRPAPLALRSRYWFIFAQNRLRKALHDHHRYAVEIFSFRNPELC